MTDQVFIQIKYIQVKYTYYIPDTFLSLDK